MASKSTGKAPPLPPRQNSSNASPYSAPPPPYESIPTMDHSADGPWASQDPRTSSTQSLVPSESNVQNERRKLILIYVHGFMGNETSFRSFPAHVHNLVTILLAETHVVHTKVYPRYRSKRNISFARDDLSKWLEPHEDAKTDVILLGHSMGGLLIAEVALMPSGAPASRPLNHRILGTINFDVPFLGMHPGVIKSGLGSIFQPAAEVADKWSEMYPEGDSATTSSAASSPIRNDTLWQPQSQDPNFDPNFANDVVLPMRKGWRNAWHFMNKHSDQLFKETKKLVTSHLEFGGAMANYGELKARYGRIRALEEENEDIRKSVVKSNEVPPRVRFVNYYTASTGRIHKPKSPTRKLSASGTASQASLTQNLAEDAARGRSHEDKVVGSQPSRSQTLRNSLEEHTDHGTHEEPEMLSSEDEDWDVAAETLTIMDPMVDTVEDEEDVEGGFEEDVEGGLDDEVAPAAPASPESPLSTISTTASMPPIPEMPPPPPPLNVSYIQDPNVRKAVEKEHARAVKTYEKGVKDRQKAIRDREKLEEKQTRKAQQASEKAARDAEKAKQKAAKDAAKNEQKAQKSSGELTHSQREHLRLAQEKERMEAEARRMRGDKIPEKEAEKSPEKEVEKTPEKEAGKSLEPVATNDSTPSTSVPESLRSRSPSPQPQAAEKPKLPKKDRKFCTLPPKDSNGERDPLWVRIFMENVDEVGAHCGLFFIDERYERLVGEVGDRVERWVKEDFDTELVRSLD